MEPTLVRKICFYLAYALLLNACSHASIADLKDDEENSLNKFDLCVRDDTLQLVSTEGTSGEIADFVMNACDSQYHLYKDAILSRITQESTHPDNKEELNARAGKLAMNMWDKIRLKVVKLVEKKRDPAIPETPRPL